MFPIDEIDRLLDKLINGEIAEQYPAQTRLAEIGVGAVLPLIELLKDPEKKNSWWLVAGTLGRIGDKRATEPLMEVLNNPMSFEAMWARRTAAWALGTLKDRLAVDGLLHILSQRSYEADEAGTLFERTDEDTIEMVEWALAEIGDLRALEPVVQRIIEDYYQDGDVLKKWGEPALDLLLNKLNNDDENMRNHAASLLGGFGDPRAVEPLIEILQNDSSPHVRQHAAYSLGSLRDPRAFDVLVAALNDPHQQTRVCAAQGLGHLKDKRAVNALKIATQDENPSVKRAAHQAILQIENQRSGRRMRESALIFTDFSWGKGAGMIGVRQAAYEDADWMQSNFDRLMGWKKPPGYFHNCCDRQAEGQLVLLVAADGDRYAGHVKVVWSPNYPYFRDNGIPEIQDLNVLPTYRRQRFASALVDTAENLIRQRSKIAGIGVGLYADYGPAQRMYVQRGYVPDGMGVTYRDTYVTPGASVPIDDDLVLFFVKIL